MIMLTAILWKKWSVKIYKNHLAIVVIVGWSVLERDCRGLNKEPDQQSVES